MSRNQIPFWMGQHLSPESPLYNTVFAFKVTGRLDPDAFSQAWQAVVDNHPILRLKIRVEEARPRAATNPEGSCSLKRMDLTVKADPQGEFKRWSEERASRVLPLDGELVDSVLLKLDEDCHGWYLNQHHLITDAVSTINLVDLVFQTYKSLLEGSATSADGPDYLDTINSIQNKANARLESAQGHFDKRPESLFTKPLFWGRPKLSETTETERIVIQLTPEESNKFRKVISTPPFASLFQELSVLSGFSAILSAWLYHVCGQRTFRFDMPMANRPSPVSRKSLGLFLEMLPFCVEIDEEDTFATLGKNCLAETQSLLKACGPGSSFVGQRNASSAILNYSPQPFKKVDGIALESEWIHSGHCDSVHGFQMQIHDYNGTGAFTLYLDFNKSCFSTTEQERGTFLMRSIINAFLENCDTCIGEVPTLSEADKEAFLFNFNSTDEQPFPEKTVVEHFQAQIDTTPDRIAVREGQESLSYSELGERVASLSALLIERGVGSGTVVAVCMRRSIDAVTGIFAVLNSGAAYVPLDPEYPPSRLAYILGDCGAKLVLTHRGLQEKLHGFEGNVLDLDKPRNKVATTERSMPSLSDQAYMIYTSGSTGQPKGVPINHDGLSDYLEWAERQYVRGEQLAFPLFTSLSFDLTVTSLFLPLMTGGTLVIYEESDGPVDSAVVDVIRDNQVDLIKLTPSHLSLLQQLDLSTSRIRRMILGGEDLKVHLADTISRQFPKPVEIFNEYGPTEAVVGCMIHKFDSKADREISVPIGKPADHVQLYVLNGRLNPVLPGIPGELCISRHGLTSGYHGRDELNAEKFVPHPWQEGQRLYRTGDLVRFNERGLLQYLGRIDRQLKISGFRIEPGEVERSLLQHHGIEACVVSSYQPGRMVGYYVAVEPLREEDLRIYLSNRLPDELIPHRFIPLKSIPLTPNGKTDFSALPNPDEADLEDIGQFIAPSGEVEEQVAEIWKSVIGAERISATSNFFQLGGTSLAAMEAMLLTGNAFEVDLPLQTIFQESTITRISEKVKEAIRRKASSTSGEETEPKAKGSLRADHKQVDGIIKRPANEPALASPGQQRIWLLHQVEPSSPNYNIAQYLEYPVDTIEVERIRQTMDEMLRRHPVLRTTFTLQDGQLVQVIDQSTPARMDIVEGDNAELLEAKVSESLLLPFDLEEGPLYRLVCGSSDGRTLIGFSFHHIIFDEWSSGIFFREFSRIFNALCKGAGHGLPEPQFDYTDFAYSQILDNQSGKLDQQLAYWKGVLENPPGPLTLATDRPYPAELTDIGSTEKIILRGQLVDAIKELGTSGGSSSFPVFLLGFQLLLSLYSRTDDILIGTPVANRRYRETGGMIGFFLNTLCLRQEFSSNPTCREALQAVREAYLEAIANQDVGLDRVLKEVDYERVSGRHPLFQHMFVFQQEDDVSPSVRLGDSTSTTKWVEGERSKFDLTLFVIEGKDSFELAIEYRSCLFNADSIRRLLGRYSVILRELVSNMGTPVSKINYMTDEDISQVDTFSQGAVIPEILNSGIGSLQLESHEAGGESLAIIGPEDSLTYADLKCRVTALAKAILQRCGGQDEPIGVLIPRSADAIVALLAVQRAGRPYLPLDPDYPDERLRFMVEDSGAGMVITTPDLAGTIAYGSSIEVLTESVLVADADSGASLPLPAEEQAAYIIYTSGSSGKPKGVSVPSACLMHSTGARFHYYPENPGNFLLIPSLSFDSSVAGVFWTLMSGGTLCLPDRQMIQDPEQLGAFIREHKVKSLLCVPSYYREILRLNGSNLQSLKMAIVAGESCPPSLVEAHFENLPDCRLYNEYGPTEATVWSTVHAIDRVESATGRIPIGKPIPNSIVHVVDRHNRLMAPGLPGEICIGGKGVTPGYLNRPESTAECFHELPPIGRIYRTGDQGIWDSSGNLHFLGRLDNQVKVRGYRIETGEIEEALLSNPHVTAAAVIIVEREDAPSYLVGFVETKEKAESSITQDLKAHLATRIPEYMIPARLIALAQLPCLPNGKVDLRALQSHLQLEVQVSVPGSDLEHRQEREDSISEILKGVLGIQQISHEDNFFNLGGDSILAIQAVARAREAGLSITVGQLLASKSIGELANLANPATPPKTLKDKPIGEAPLTPIQSWLLEKKNLDPSHWNLSVLLKVDAVIKIEDIQESILKLIDHHDALRTAICKKDSEWKQVILPNNGRSFQLESVHCPDGDRQSIIRRTADELHKSINLEKGELVRGAFFHSEDREENQLLLIINHIAVDWVSWKILLEDLQSLLDISPGAPSALPPKTAPFRTWAKALADFSGSKAIQGEINFWKNQAYRRCPKIPLDSGTPEDNLEGSEEILQLEFNQKETGQIIEVASKLGVTVQAILYGGIIRSLGKWCSSSSILVDLEGHGREDCVQPLDTTRTVGWFTSQFPVVLNARNSSSDRVFFKGIQAELDDIPNRGVGFGILKYLARNDPEISAVPDAEVTLNYLGRLETAVDKGPLSVIKWSIGDDRKKESPRTAIIEVNAFLSADRLVANWSFSRNLHRKSTITKLADDTRAFLSQATDTILQQESGQLAYPLTNAQSTLLAHHLQKNSEDQGQIQLKLALTGVFKESLFREAWQHVVETFPVMRTTVHWEELSEPVQFVHQKVEWDVSIVDCMNCSDEETASQLASITEKEVATPLQLATAPTFRLSILRASETSTWLLWTCHHIILDGWSSALILRRMVKAYNQLLSGVAPERVESAPFKDYCEWLFSRSHTRARMFWRSQFKGMKNSPLVSATLQLEADTDNQPRERHRVSLRMESLEQGGLEKVAGECRITPFAVLLSTWTVLLSELLETDRVVTGLTVSGRYDRVPGEENMAGMLANTIPVVAHLNRRLTFKEWCREFFGQLQKYREFDYCSEKQILEWTDLPRTLPLFDCLFIFANQPIDQNKEDDPDSLSISDIKGGFTSGYPLTVIFRNWNGFYIDVIVDREAIDPAVADHLASRFSDIFSGLDKVLDQSLADLKCAPSPFKRVDPLESEPESAFLTGGTVPGNPVESHIQEIWQAVFQRKPLGLEADFFSIGGNSLLATYLIAELNDALDQEVAMDAIFQAPTIRSLANLVQTKSSASNNAKDDSLLVPIKAMGDKIPLIMIHPLDGDIYQYHLLGQHLPDDQPFYAIRAPSRTFTNVDEMAEHYTDLVLQNFPDGRFLLGGYCFGAGVALQMLHKMSEQGLKLYPLVAIDFMYLNLVRYRPRYLLKLLRDENLHSLTQRIRGWSYKIGKRLKRLFNSKGTGLERDIEDHFELPELPEATRQQIEANFFLLDATKPKPYYGDVALLLSDSVYSRNDKWVGWDRFAKGRLYREIVDVEHTQMMEEARIGKVAKALVRLLDQIHTKA
nr:non-ribosomal peptide synthetase [Oceanipulchritudo coccoides]